jgi:hypothetical protein
MIEIAKGYFRSRVLCAAARLGVADAMGGGAREVEAIATACGADAESLYRLLRALAAMGLTAETAPGSFELTPMGEPLRKDVPGSVWPQVIFWGDLIADNWAYLTDCVRTGQTAPQVMASENVQSRWSKEPSAQAIFRAVMGTAPVEDYLPLVRSWDFSRARVVADLGGGGGSLLCAVLENYPHVRGMLVDWPEAIEAARPRFQATGLLDRCSLIGEDLTKRVPAGADVYVLKSVLHGYKDQGAVKLLKHCRAVIPHGGALLVIEALLPDVVTKADESVEARIMSDLNMMAVTGGRERSAAEWKKLLGLAGFELARVIPAGVLSIMEGRAEAHPA